MGAVACADTVDLGYGMYGSTSPTVKAVEVMHISTDTRLRNQEQDKFLKVANKSAVDTINNVVKAQTGVAVEPVKGTFLMVTPSINCKVLINKDIHIGGLIVINYSKNAIDQVIGMNKTILEKGSDAEKPH